MIFAPDNKPKPDYNPPAVSPYICITIDVDWAPDFVIRDVAQMLSDRKIPATWFVTHRSDAIDDLRKTGDLFELGIHPNFQERSTHGGSVRQILEHCLSLVPEARSIRTHGLYQSTSLLRYLLYHTSLTTDVSLYLPRARHVEPVRYYDGRHSLLRVPFVFEDDFEIMRPDTLIDCSEIIRRTENLVVFNFHPIHIYLNSASMESYERLKQRVSYIAEATIEDFHGVIHSGTGIRTCFLQLLDLVQGNPRVVRIRDIAENWFHDSPSESFMGKAA